MLTNSTKTGKWSSGPVVLPILGPWGTAARPLTKSSEKALYDALFETSGIVGFRRGSAAAKKLAACWREPCDKIAGAHRAFSIGVEGIALLLAH